MTSSKSVSVIDLQFEMKRLCDGDLRREIISMPLSEFEFSVSFLQNLVETKFNIPLICQVGLSMSGVPLDCLPPESDLFPSRIWKSGERIVLSLQYYTNSAMVRPIHKLLTSFEQALESANYRLMYVILNTLNHDHVNEQGWQSNEAIGTRIYLTSRNFLPLLFDCIDGLNQQLLEVYQKHESLVALDSTDNQTMLRQLGTDDAITQPPLDCVDGLNQQLLLEDFKKHESFVALDSTDNQAMLRELGTADSITLALDAALGLLWNFGANSTDRILLFSREFLELCQRTTQLAYYLICCPYKEFNGNGKALFGKCLGVIQGFSELRSPAISIGRNIRFLQILQHFIINPADYNRELLEPVLQVLIFFSCSSQNEISQILCENHFYHNLLIHFSRSEISRDYSSISFEVSYIACLLMLNWLKTPQNVQRYTTDTIEYMLILFTKFYKKVKIENIIKFEEDTRFIWGSLDPFVSFFFIPKNSFIGEVLHNSALYDAKVHELCQRYFQIALFALDVLLSREANRKQLIQERLLSYLIIANWFLPSCGILPRIKKCYPEIHCSPVPSLYDIAATQAVRRGLRDFTEVIHPSI